MTDSKTPDIVTPNLWASLKYYTDARIGLGRAGVSLPTTPLLDFQLAHAQAQDAVHTPLNTEQLITELAPLATRFKLEPTLQLHSQVTNRAMYLQRPDLGRRLNEDSVSRLNAHTSNVSVATDLSIVVVDGLSSRAITENTLPFLTALLTTLQEDQQSWKIAPLCIVEQGRVAIGDEVGQLINARAVLVLIGERPGLSSPDSLGLYLTWSPRVGLTDVSRNCISNVRLAGLSYQDAVRKTLYLLKESRQRQLSGVDLKERSEDSLITSDASDVNFLTPNHITKLPR